MTNCHRIMIASAGIALALSEGALAQQYAVVWSSIDSGGNTIPATGGPYGLIGTVGQPDAGALSGGTYAIGGGFGGGGGGGPPPCYANCDGSSVAPILNVNDFICFA